MTICNIGIIGYGGFGRFLHRAWSAMDRVRILAIADVQKQRPAGQVRVYTRWQDLIADAEIDVVSIATPPGTHAEIACAALERGKHVLVEKPLATTREDAYRIRDVRDRTGRGAAVNYMLRFNPIVETLHAWSRRTPFGPLRRVMIENYAQDDALPPGHWFWDPRQSGGILVEHAVHFIDLVNGCTPARPRRIDGVGIRRNPRQEDRMMITVVYDDGLAATQYHAFSRPGFFEHTSLRFVFDLAQVEVEGWIPLSGRVRALVRGETEAALAELPGFALTRREDVETQDEPHPQDDGATGRPATPRRRVYAGGEPYDVDAFVEGTFALVVSKEEAYAAALCALLADFVAAVEDPNHRLRVSLEDGLASLDIALEATRQAHAA